MPIVPVTPAVIVEWEPDTPTDISDRVLLRSAITCQRGKDQIRLLSPAMAGLARCEVDNRSRDYSSENGDSPLAGLVEPGKQFQIDMAWDSFGGISGGAAAFDDSEILEFEDSEPIEFESTGGVDAGSGTMFRGPLDDIGEQPNRDNQSVVLTAFGSLSRLVGKTISTDFYSSLTIDQAVGYILDQVDWPALERRISASSVTLQNWSLSEVDAFSALSDLLNTEGPGGAIYETAGGVFVFEDRNFRTRETRSVVSNFVFDDTYFQDLKLSPSFKDVINQCTIAIQRREPQPEQVIWELGSALTIPAGESRVFTVQSSDPFFDARVPSPVGSNTTFLLQASDTLTSGDYKVKFRGEVSAGTVPYNATEDDFQAAFEGLSTIGPDNVVCAGGPINTNGVRVTLIGSFAGQDITDLIEIVESTLNPTSVPASIVVGTIHDGDGILSERQSLTASDPLNAGSYVAVIPTPGVGGGGATSSIDFDDSPSDIQTKIRAVGGFGSALVSGVSLDTPGGQIQINLTYSENLDDIQIVPSGLTAAIAGATINVTKIVMGGVADYVLLAGSIASITLDRTGGFSCTITVTAGGSGASLSGLRLRATKLSVVSNTNVLNSVDASASITKYGIKPITPSVWPDISPDDALSLSNLYVSKNMNRRPIVNIEFLNDAALLLQQKDREISDRVTVQNFQTAVDGDFWIEQINHYFLEGGLLRTVFGCEKVG